MKWITEVIGEVTTSRGTTPEDEEAKTTEDESANQDGSTDEDDGEDDSESEDEDAQEECGDNEECIAEEDADEESEGRSDGKDASGRGCELYNYDSCDEGMSLDEWCNGLGAFGAGSGDLCTEATDSINGRGVCNPWSYCDDTMQGDYGDGFLAGTIDLDSEICKLIFSGQCGMPTGEYIDFYFPDLREQITDPPLVRDYLELDYGVMHQQNPNIRNSHPTGLKYNDSRLTNYR